MTYITDYELVMKRRRAGLFGGSFLHRLELKAAKIVKNAGIRPPASQIISGSGGKKNISWKWLVDKAYKLELRKKSQVR
jgi:hypothetical protein